MQCARAQQQGAFANELYGRVLEDMLFSKAFSAELLGACHSCVSPARTSSVCDSQHTGALASRYLQHPDVRYYTHTVLRKCELLQLCRVVARLTPSAACLRLCDRGCKPSLESGAAAACQEDVVRNAFDVLCSAPAVFALDEQSPSWCRWEAEAARVGRKRSASVAAGAAPATGTPRWADSASQRRAFSEAWLSFLRLELPLDIYKARGDRGYHVLR